jgi:hypothetical protein
MGGSKKSRRDARRLSGASSAMPETVAVSGDRPADGGDTLVLDDFSVSRLRKFFELLDRWDRQESASNSM